MKPQVILEIPAQRLQTALHYEDMITLIESDNTHSWIHSSCSMRDYIVITIVEQGSMTLLVNGITQLHINQPGIIYHFPEHVFEVLDISDDQRSKNILMSRTFARQLDISNSFDLRMSLAKQLFLPMDEETLQAMMQYYEMCKRMLQMADNPYRLDTLRHITIAYFLNFNYYIHQRQKTQSSTREEKVAMQFLALLNTHFKQEHQIGFYAEQLCLTPKYMSQCVKQVTGYAAKDCINHYIISYAQQMLRSSEVTISEVCYELCFAELTAFGKYFKTHTGISPKEYITRNR